MIRARGSKTFYGKNQEVFRLEFDFELESNEFVSLHGISGAGKTSLIKTIAGLIRPDEGRIEVEDQIWFDSDKKIDLPIAKRNIGFVFQESSLFPNMTVRENLEFALPSKKSNPAILFELVEVMNIGDLLDRKIQGLSGGQKQRISLARAVIRRPRYLFLDEPFSSLDRPMRFQLQALIQRLHRELESTTILISHEIPEIFRLSNQVFIMDTGRILKKGSPREIFQQTNSSNRIVNVGEVVEVHKESSVIIVWMMNALIEIKSTPNISELSPGDKVEVEFDYTEMKVRKL